MKTRPWTVRTITGFAGGHGDDSDAEATLKVATKANTVEEIRALCELAPELAEALTFLVTVIKRNDAPLTASMEYAHAVKLLARLEGGEK